MIEGLLVLLVCQIVGELAVRTLHLAVPGPVLGMLLLLAVLVVRRPRQDAPVLRAGDRVLEILPLLFVPAGVGVMTQVALLRAQWLPIGAGLVVSWVVALLATAGAAALVHRGGPAPTDDQARALVADADRIEGLEDGPAPSGGAR